MGFNKDWVAYVGPFNFPWGQAGSRRVYGNAMSLVEAGYDVIVASGDAPSALKTFPSAINEGATLTYLGVGEIPLSGGYLGKLWQHLINCGVRTVNWLSEQPVKPKYVVIYGGLAAFSWHVYRWCRQNHVPVIADVVEWYDPAQMLGGRFGPFYVSANMAFHGMYPRFDGVIAISSFLERHFSPAVPVITVPPTVELTGAMPTALERDHVLRLVYAGVPGKKDLLGEVISAICMVSGQINVHLQIIGPSLNEVLALSGLRALPPVISVLGRLPQEAVKAELIAADFSILVRESRRFTNAGFPTKFVESMAASTPVIANITSDLGDYLVDSINGFVVQRPTAESIAETIRKAGALNAGEKHQMKVRAYQTAAEKFIYQRFSEDFKNFLFRVDAHHGHKKGAR